MDILGIDLNNLNYTFQKENFLLGMLAGWGSAYVLYRARHTLGAARSAVAEQAAGAQEFASRSADSRYIGDLYKFCEATHLAGESIPLSEVLIEPRFIAAPELVHPVEADVLQSVFHVVPHIPDYPYLHAPYNIATLSLDDLGTGDQHIALLGLPGSGRTTTLMTIALWSLGKVKFAPPVDKVQQRLEEEEAAIEKDDERAQRIRERLQMEEMAMQSLATKQGTDVEQMVQQASRGTLFKQLTPVYAHFGNIRCDSREFSSRVDPAEPLLRAVQQHTGGVTARTMAGSFYSRLNEGKVLLLLDGFDELPAVDQPAALRWLESYLAQYAANFLIVTGPADGYGNLLRAGLAPVFLRPWSDVEMARLADRWAEAWPQISGKRRRQAELEERTLAYAKARNRAHTPLELTLKIWATYTAQDTTDPETRIKHLLTQFLPEDKLAELLPKLTAAAQMQLEEGYITAERLEQIFAPVVPADTVGAQSAAPSDEESPATEADTVGAKHASPESPESETAEETDDFDFLEEERAADTLTDAGESATEGLTGETGTPEEAVTEAEKPEKIGKEYVKLIEMLDQAGLLTRFRGHRYQFRHPLLAAYFASLTLKEADAETLQAKAVDPAWQSALTYAAMHTPLDAAVQARLAAPPDVLRNQLLGMTPWLAYVPDKVEWRTTLLRQLGNLFVAPNQYLSARERVAAALISARDKNVMRIFRAALKHPNTDVRRLACLGLGALQVEEVIGDLTERLTDSDTNVTLAAGIALGAIGSNEAFERMVTALTEGTENLRQAVAEAFAAIPDEGYPILFDAAYAEDYLLRRAAVFGLRRINTGWALIALYRRSIEDDQWYVRSAAATAFEEMQYGHIAGGAHKYPPVEEIAWLRDWAAGLGQEVGAATGGDAAELLRKALEQGQPEIQRLSAANMGQLGLANQTGLLYTTLRHRDDRVREAAFRALGDLQLHIGRALPSPA